MKMILERTDRLLTCTIGSLFIDGRFSLFILEDVDREIPGVPVEKWKIKGNTAIPTGVFDVKLTFSNRFQKIMPLLVNVPGYEGVRIHTGNTDADTDGCLICGSEVSGEAVTGSRKAYDRLFAELKAAEDRGEPVTIEIRRAYD